MARPDGIAVLCTVGSNAGEHTRLLRLRPAGDVEAEYASPGIGRALAALPEDGYAVAGETRADDRGYAAHVLRLDAAGAPAASRTLGPSGVSGLTAVAALADGTMVVGGSRAGRGWLLAVDAELEPVWQGELGDEVVGIAACGDGFAAVAVAGRTTTALGTGALAVWGSGPTERGRMTLPAEPSALGTMHGDLVVVGHAGDSPRLWAARIGADLTIAWQRDLDAAGRGCRGRAVSPLPDGGVAVAGDARRSENRGAYLAELDGDGSMVWERALDPAAQCEEVVAGIACAADGVVVAGTRTAVKTGAAAAVVRRFDGDGRLSWERVIGG